MKLKAKSWIAIVLALAITLSVAPAKQSIAADSSAYDSQLNDLNSRYDTLEKQQQQIQSEINRAKTEKDKQLAAKKQLDNQIYNTRQQINILNDKISLLEKEIAQKQAEIAEKQAEIDKNYDMLKQRLKAMYTSGNSTVLGLVLGAGSFAEFLTRAEVASRISQHDQELIDSLVKVKGMIDQDRIQVEKNKTDIEGSKTQVAKKQSELGVQLKTTESQIQDIGALETEYKKNAAKLQKEMDQLQSEMDTIYANIHSEGEYAGGKLGWPVAGFTTITSDYGWRFSNTNFHTGIDIAGKNSAGSGIYGQNIFIRTRR